MMGVWRGDAFGVAVWCVFPSGEYENGSAGECVTVKWALVIACSMARLMHSWSYSGLAMLVPYQVWGALLPFDKNTMSSR
jgi:hypothetical protein